MVQPIEPKEEPIDSQLNRSNSNSTDQGVQKKLSLSSRMVVQSVKVEPQHVDSHLNRSRFGQGVVEVQQPPTKY